MEAVFVSFAACVGIAEFGHFDKVVAQCGLYDFDFAKLLLLTPLDFDEVLGAIDDLKEAALAMMQDIQRSDAKSPKQLMNELFGF